MSETSAQEPSMEEILASIRRIISDDGSESAPSPASQAHVGADEDDVLELNIPAMTPQAGAAMAMESEDEDDDLKTFAFGLDDDLEVAVEPPVIAPPVDVQDALVSSVAQAAAASAFDRLAQTVAMPEQGRTIEDVVQELLRPLLKAWLDENLLPIVQAKVEEEVERIARRRF
jgi:hypothetical protein